MSLEYFYGEMKAVLKFFDLDWNQKHEVDVSIMPRSIVFRHGNREIHIALPSA